MLRVTPGRPFCDDEMRGTTGDAATEATSEIRLSALGTAQFCKSPTNGEVAVPLPLPNELAPPDGCAPPAVLAELLDAPAEFAPDCPLTGCATGTLAPVLAVEPELERAAPCVLPAAFPPDVPKD